MKQTLLFSVLLLLLQSCIPIKFAPNIEDYKIVRGSKFKKGLPSRNIFVFEDNKDANEFYNYVNAKFNLEDIKVMDDVPFEIEGNQYFFSFYEVDKTTKSLDMLPFLTSVITNADDTETPTMDREDSYYIAIEVYSDFENDCLAMEALSRTLVLKYLRELKEQYQNTQNN